MKLLLSSSCPIFEPAHTRELGRLLELVAKGWHAIATPSFGSLPQLVPAELWATYEEFVAKRYKLVATSSEGRYAPTNCAACDPSELVAYLELGLQVVVENANTDGAFVQLLADLLNPPLARALRSSRVDVRTAGGSGEILKEVRRLHASRVARLPSGAPPRIFALVDSDSERPGAVSVAAATLVEETEALGCEVHVLAKRSIENYVPDRALRAMAEKRSDRRPAIEYVGALEAVARDHYPMKTGLKAPPPAGSVFPADAPLGLGLGDFISDLLTNFRHSLERRDLQVRDGVGELDGLVGRLEGTL